LVERKKNLKVAGLAVLNRRIEEEQVKKVGKGGGGEWNAIVEKKYSRGSD